MKVDVSKFFDLKEVDWRIPCDGVIEYDIILINKLNKEEYVIALLDEDFDKLLRDMEEELLSTQIDYYLLKYEGLLI